MSRADLPDLIFTELVHTLQELPSISDSRQAHAICLAISRAFSPDRPDSFNAGRQAERDRTMALIQLRMEQLQDMPSHRKQIAELLALRAAILDPDTIT